MYWLRALGGTLYLVGAVLSGVELAEDLGAGGRPSTRCRCTRRQRLQPKYAAIRRCPTRGSRAWP